jgi:hypothetical protein
VQLDKLASFKPCADESIVEDLKVELEKEKAETERFKWISSLLMRLNKQ